MSNIKTWKQLLNERIGDMQITTNDDVRLAMQDHIDALTEALKVAQSVNVLLRKTRETARAERDALQTQRDMWESMFKEVRAERDALQAKLSATEAQKFTVHERSFIYDTHGRCLPTLTLAFNPDDWGSRDNFAAPVAPAQPVNELVEACGRYEAALNSAFPLGAKGEAFEQWNAARKVLAKRDAKAAQPLTKEQVQPAKYGSPNNKIRRDYDRVLTKSSAFYLDPISKKWICQEDGLYSVGGKIINAKNGDVLAASGEQVQPAQGGATRLTDEQKEWVTDNPNTNDLVEFIEAFAHRATILQSNAERVPLTPAQRVDIADACANLDYDDNFLGDLGKIIDLVEAAHGITKGQQ